jgi:uncharacterized SAM-dependent methyltransferase
VSAFILCVDLVKETEILKRAYDDAAGATAARGRGHSGE